MTSGSDPPDTPALDYLAATDLEYEVVRTGPVSGIDEAARRRGIPVGAVLKTLVVRVEEGEYVFVLVPGDRAIDWSKLRSHLGVRRLSLPDAERAHDVTGYPRGAITPFGSSHAWPVVADARLMGFEVVSIGGGAHGVSVTIEPVPLCRHLDADVADVTKGIDVR